MTDYYELLQISRNADAETIHRMYRMMAARLHPDNPKTGDVERFLALERAYRVLSDPERRAEYDTLTPFQTRGFHDESTPDFADDSIEGEWSRRLAVLSLLYQICRTNPDQPGISPLKLEQRIGLSAEHLNFTLWYLKSKGYISMGENSDFHVTVLGADYFESKASAKGIMKRLEAAA